METIYSVGTVTVANGGTTVTGVGTSWQGKIFAGDLFTDPAQGIFARVTADATSNTSLSINAWPGTALSGDAYEVLLTPDSVRSSERTRQLLEQLSVVQANGRGLFYRFSDTTADADPGAGYIRLNNADPTLATAAYIDVLDANGATVSAILDSWDDQATAAARGQLWIRGIADPSAFHGYKVTGSVVDGTGYRKVTLTYIGGSGSFAADDELMVAFSAQGADGTNAILGVWQGAWLTATAYDVDDLVEQGGSTYICLEAHTSGTFSTDLAADKWDLAVEKGDTGATGATGETGATGAQGERGINWQGDYSAGTTYATDDGVLYNGSSWRALGATTGNAPPTLPTTSNAYWQLLARQGIDGAGTVNSVVAGTGIAVDNTDPTAPVVSVTNAEPVGYGDLLITVSLLALQVADNTNVALFLGDAGNRVADSFETTTYVDVAGATNLNSSTAGVLKPTTTAESMISQATGTTFGDMNDGSGAQSLWVDGTTNAGSAGTTNSASTTGPRYAGKTFPSPVSVSKAMVYGRNDSGFVNASTPDVTVQLYYKDGTAPSGPTDGTQVGTLTFTEGANESAGRAITSSETAPHDHWWVVFSHNGSANVMFLVELQFYAPGVTNNLTVRSASFTAASAPTAMKALLRLKEVDAAVAGTDYTLECSRDGGTTWTAMTLTELFTSASPTAGMRVVEAAETDVSGQPSGTSPRWRFKTLNNKMVELHDVYLYWD